MIHKNHEELDLQCNFSHFRNCMRKFYHKIFFIILILTESFRAFLFQAWGVVAVAHLAGPIQR